MKEKYPTSHEIMIALARKCGYGHYKIALDYFDNSNLLKFYNPASFDYCYLFNTKHQIMPFTLDSSVNQENIFDKLLSKEGILVKNRLALNEAVRCMTHIDANKEFSSLFKFNQTKEEIIIGLQMEGYL